MGRGITNLEAIEAAWSVQLPSVQLDMPLSKIEGFKRLRAARGSKAYADMGVWLGLCSLASRHKGHALPLDFDLLAQWLFDKQGKSTVAAEHVNALIAVGLAFVSEDDWLLLPTINAAAVRHGKMIVGGARGGRPRGKKKRR